MKEAADYAGPPIAARRRRRLLQFHRNSESKFKYDEESRRNSPAYANGRHFYVRPETPFPLVDNLSTIENLRASGNFESLYRLNVTDFQECFYRELQIEKKNVIGIFIMAIQTAKLE